MLRRTTRVQRPVMRLIDEIDRSQLEDDFGSSDFDSDSEEDELSRARRPQYDSEGEAYSDGYEEEEIHQQDLDWTPSQPEDEDEDELLQEIVLSPTHVTRVTPPPVPVLEGPPSPPPSLES